MWGQGLVLAPESERLQHPAMGERAPRIVRLDVYSDFRRLIPSNFSMYFS